MSFADLCREAFRSLEANKGRIKEPRIVSAPDSAVTLVVYPTNEELAIARQALTFA